MFVISNVFSVVSPSITFEKDINPFSGAIVTSGLTPLPFKATETIVDPEYITTRSSYIYYSSGSNCITIGFVSPGLIVLIAFKTQNPPKGVKASNLIVSFFNPTFFINIS